MKKSLFLFADREDFLAIKLIGELRFLFAPTLEKGLVEVRDCMIGKEVIIDITDVNYADSTILGIITGFFIREEDQGIMFNKAPTIICNDKDMRKILSNIGFDKYFNFKESDPRLNFDLSDYKEVGEMKKEQEDLEEYVKQAHQVLRDINESKTDHDLVIKSFKK